MTPPLIDVERVGGYLGPEVGGAAESGSGNPTPAGAGVVAYRDAVALATIVTVGVPVVPDGTWESAEFEWELTPATGLLTYAPGTSPFGIYGFMARVTIAPVSGGNIDFSLYIRRNGLLIPHSRSQGRTDNGRPVSLFAMDRALVAVGATVDLVVVNDTNTTNLNCHYPAISII